MGTRLHKLQKIAGDCWIEELKIDNRYRLLRASSTIFGKQLATGFEPWYHKSAMEDMQQGKIERKNGMKMENVTKEVVQDKKKEGNEGKKEWKEKERIKEEWDA